MVFGCFGLTAAATKTATAATKTATAATKTATAATKTATAATKTATAATDHHFRGVARDHGRKAIAELAAAARAASLNIWLQQPPAARDQPRPKRFAVPRLCADFACIPRGSLVAAIEPAKSRQSIAAPRFPCSVG
jgi:hypothetical protein